MVLRKDRKLKSAVIEPFKQFKIGIYIVVTTFIFIVCAGYLFMSSFWQQYQHVMSIFKVVDPNLQWEVVTNDVFFVNTIKISVLFLLFMLITMAMVFKLTHRYYGPLVSIEKFVDQVADGNYSSRVSLRKKDELQRLAAKLNTMAESLEQRHRRGDQSSA